MGRGKGGGVKLAKNIRRIGNYCWRYYRNAIDYSSNTRQKEKKVNQVLVAEDVYYPGASEPSEYYMSVLLLNRATGKNMIMYSTEGGMDIEAVAEATPHLIFTEEIDPALGLHAFSGA